jgi:hypothetical protein
MDELYKTAFLRFFCKFWFDDGLLRPKHVANSIITIEQKYNFVKQAKQISQYKKIKIKLYRNNAAIWYNKTCRIKQLTPNYINIRVNGNNTRSPKNEKYSHPEQNKPRDKVLIH